jgi:hypothetical protein
MIMYSYGFKIVQTSNIELMQPSSSGLFFTCAYLDQTTFPVSVTNPNYEILA